MQNLRRESLILLAFSAGMSALMIENKTQAIEAIAPVRHVSTQSMLTIAQAAPTADQIPSIAAFDNVREIKFEERMNGVLNNRSLRYRGRLYDLYQFNGNDGQSVRISLAAGLSRNRPTNQIRTNTLLVYPVLILLNANGDIIAQEPETADVSGVVIRRRLPANGTYYILVTSRMTGIGGRYTLGLQDM